MIQVAKPYIGEKEKKAVMEVLESGMIAQGKRTAALEEDFARTCGTKHAVAVSSGTAALHASLYAMGVKQGDEVITTPFTFVATANPIIMQNAKPVFADIDPDSYNIDPESIKEMITSKTKAIIPVDLYGQIYDHKAISEIAEDHGLVVMEDACQAIGATSEGKNAGSFGDMAAFSLYATKNIMSGEGGMITTDDPKFAEMARRFRHHGQSAETRYQYFDLGYNYRMTDIQAAIASVQLSRLGDFTKKRQANAAILDAGLKELAWLKTPVVSSGNNHVYHQYTIRIEDDSIITRDKLIEQMKEAGIGCGVFYPKPLHMHPNFSRFGYKEGDFFVSEDVSKRVVSLPVHPQVSEEDIKKIVEFFRGI